MTGTVVTWLTQEAHDRLQHELDELVAHRPVIAAEINARREEGDLKENGGYHAARDEQAKQEARIRHLQEILRSAQVGVSPADDGVVEPGMVVTIAYDGDDDDRETFLLGSREEGVHGSHAGVFAAIPARSGDPRRQPGRVPRVHPAQRPGAEGRRARRQALRG